MWVAAIDFKKAFDSTQHDAIWRSLRNHFISEEYICLVRTVLTDFESDEFEVARGTKQCDLLRSLLSTRFTPLSNGEGHWYLENDKGLGIKLGGKKRDCISNLRLC